MTNLNKEKVALKRNHYKIKTLESIMRSIVVDDYNNNLK
jgi:hypothetical protein